MSQSAIPLPHRREDAASGTSSHPSDPDTASQVPSADSIAPSLPSRADLTQVSLKLIPARFLGNLLWWLIFIGGAAAWNIVVWQFGWPWWTHLFSIPLYIGVVQSIIFTPRRVRALGYAIRDNDIVIREGLMFRSLTIVPFGRIQSIEINEGPIERRFGLSSIELNTAGASLASTTTIPGLPREESEHVRDLVAREANEKMAAL